MGEKISKVIFGFISLFMFGAFIYYVRGMSAQNFINVLLILFLAIITNPYIIDRISKKVGVEVVDYLYACKMLLIFGGIVIAFIISAVLFSCTNNEIDEGVATQSFEAILKIAVYIVYLIVLLICKSADKFFKYIVFGIIYFISIILSFSSQSINENIIVFLNYLTESHLDLSSFEILINDLLIPVKEAILTYIIFDTIIENQNNKAKTVAQGEDKKEVEESTSYKDVHYYVVNVFDSDINKSSNYRMNIHKK